MPLKDIYAVYGVSVEGVLDTTVREACRVQAGETVDLVLADLGELTLNTPRPLLR